MLTLASWVPADMGKAALITPDALVDAEVLADFSASRGVSDSV